jgi:hypothetical protein
MRKTLLNILLIFSISVNAQEVLYLKKGTLAPYNGYLFNEEKASNLKKEMIEKDGLTTENQLLKRKIELNDLNEQSYIKQKDILEKQNDRLVNEITKNKSMSTVERVVWFGLGILATGLAVSGARKLYNE